eukprot:CAMPEP_0170192758 /NCGR_PEP_ID=MMETSP0040_2-20121228/55132_1 /TAXON_ID=641309 /ORGANISM="Lotharella oceanica, Strain CCMP622" /LENGTH=181 /DNA_ID=CAMNT_0010441205 /DNA_START=486 /DNA_END=1031 /DNA_ORIENTATION=+
MLEDVWEGNTASFQAIDGSKGFVHLLVVAKRVHFLHASVVVLFVGRISNAPTERKRCLGDVFLIVVVDSSGHNALVLHPLDVPGASSEGAIPRPDNGRTDFHNYLQPPPSKDDGRGLRWLERLDFWLHHSSSPMILELRTTSVCFLRERARHRRQSPFEQRDESLENSLQIAIQALMLLGM